MEKIPLNCNDFVTSVARLVIELKIVKLFTLNSEYLKLVFFTIS